MLPSYLHCFQFDVKAGDPAANLARVKEAMAELNPAAGGLLLLPELWSAGFSYDRFAWQGRQTDFILEELVVAAGKYGVMIAGTLPEKAAVREKEHYFNTMFFTGPEGVIGRYRKQHLFPPLAEERYFSPGDRPDPVSTDMGVIGALVCFDIRFPELARYQVRQGAELIVVSGQWPATRQQHWQTLLQARAIENQVYVAACNRCGESGGTLYQGGSLIIAPDGAIIREAGDQEGWFGCPLQSQVVHRARTLFTSAGKFPYSFFSKDKIVEPERLVKKVDLMKQNGSTVVFTNGCFDILHAGHVSYLEEARKEGDCLVVGVNSDSSVQAVKGPGRPVNREESRARVLAGLECVDYVVIFEEKTPLRIIKKVLPHVLVKGADWSPEKIVGAAEVEAVGGRVKNVELVADLSTSHIINKIKAQD
ncbi:MAG: D-glycero-beta-D-manno-heptose 1-phosphate adenylyltransferase [Desulfurivibrionaceae bacterium]